MQIEGRLRKGWGYGFILEDNQGKQVAEMLFKREAHKEFVDAFIGGLRDNRQRAYCNITIDENGLRLELIPKDAIQPKLNMPLGVSNTGDIVGWTSVNEQGMPTTSAPIYKKKIGRPKGAKNKKTLLKEQEVIEQNAEIKQTA